LRSFVIAVLCCAPLSAQQTAVPTDALNQTLPRWINFAGEARLRLEGFSGGGFRSGNDDLYLLERFRFSTTLRPAPWWKIVAQTQDARVWGENQHPPSASHQNTWDLRQAYAEIGDFEKSPLAARVGRQEISLGGERLVGLSTWTNVSRSFDAARAIFRYRNFKLDAFAASIVVLRDGQIGSADAGNNLHGLYGTITKLPGGSTLEPYLLWRLEPHDKTEAGAPGNLDMKVSGARWLGKLGAFEYNTSWVFERGRLASDRISAWGAAGLLGYTFAGVSGAPRVAVEFDYASGDPNPHDGRRNTFELLYPTRHDLISLSDQIGWKNIEHIRGRVDWEPGPRWIVTPSYSAIWLANAHDGLYNPSGVLVAGRTNGGSADRWVGQEVDLAAQYSLTRVTQIGAGFAHIFPGTFLERAAAGHAFSYPYLQISTKF
jgi:alginate export protein